MENLEDLVANALKEKGYKPIKKYSPEFINDVEWGKHGTIIYRNNSINEYGIAIYYHDNIAEFGISRFINETIVKSCLNDVPMNNFKNAIYEYTNYLDNSNNKIGKISTTFKEKEKYYIAELIKIGDSYTGHYDLNIYSGNEPESIKLEDRIKIKSFSIPIMEKVIGEIYNFN